MTEDIQLFKQSYEEAKKSRPDLGRLELIGIVCSCRRCGLQDALGGLRDSERLKETTHVFGITMESSRDYVFCYGDAYKPKNINYKK